MQVIVYWSSTAGRSASSARRRRRGRRPSGPTREVILAAGAYNSPQLLMLSGIGPAELLPAAESPVVADLPGVGANLQDHVLVRLQLRRTAEPVSLLDGEHERARRASSSAEGPRHAHVEGRRGGGFIRTRLRACRARHGAALRGPVMFVGRGWSYPPEHALLDRARAADRRASRGVRRARADPTAAAGDPCRTTSGTRTTWTQVAARPAGLRIASPARAARLREGGLHCPPASDVRADVRDLRPRLLAVDLPPRRHVRDGLGRGRASCACAASRACGSPTPRSCRRVVRGHTNAPAIMIGEKAADLISGNVRTRQLVAAL